MNIREIRSWLGLYFLIVTSILGAYLLIFKNSIMLPLDDNEASGVFQIIIPVLVGQLTIIFKWYGVSNKEEDYIVDIPKWVVKAPLLIITTILAVSLLNLIIGNLGEGQQWVISAQNFKSVVTFCVSILNATSVFVISRFFKAEN